MDLKYIINLPGSHTVLPAWLTVKKLHITFFSLSLSSSNTAAYFSLSVLRLTKQPSQDRVAAILFHTRFHQTALTGEDGVF